MMRKDKDKYFKLETLDLVKAGKYENYRASPKKADSTRPRNNKRKRTTSLRYSFWLIGLFFKKIIQKL